MDDDVTGNLIRELYDDINHDDEFPNTRPLLAHYTSLDALEKILKTDEIWFANPLFMNDLEEVVFGFVHGATRIKNNHQIRKSLQTEARYQRFTHALDYYISDFDNKHLLDTYIFCLSEHDSTSSDGVLSMWRGYGGNGNGVALVFDTEKINYVENSPLRLLRVSYGSLEERFEWIDNIASVFATIISERHIADEKIYLASHALFERVKLFALSSKHDGFKEEKEWRAVYMSDLDNDGALKPMQHYLNGPRGVEPKLRFKIQPIQGLTSPDFSLDTILTSIILGPSTSSVLAVRSIERMLDLIEKPVLKSRLIASSIPLRLT